MTDDIKNAASALQAQVTEAPEFKELSEAYATLKADKDTFELFENFQNMQMSLQQKQASGQQPSEDELTQAQTMAQQMSTNGKITDLMNKEQALNNLLNDINKIVTQPIVDLYRN
ncbi:YlbF family regulator [Lentilactobacillus sp. SPB1-3]|uniref:YlbF family regulator n=1 Tax=Lentilactobacillus terminaliae TaxID=3003483 RepID=A0ACD5DHQ8_9LACO|nr:YlbF family regulator [Lentilactobacillus sp. SPB1-3]MCZ0977062.1 YlbF family regulator [Lentilactobacillus sp. SPB1-3]